jgi:hypothetical protein
MPQVFTGAAQNLNGGSTLASAPAQTASGLEIATMTNLANLAGQSLTTDGYKKLGGGVVVQWGNTTLGATSTTPVSFLIPFTTVFQVIAVRDLAGTANTSSLNITAVGNSGFSYVNTGGVGCGGRFIAVGYVA